MSQRYLSFVTPYMAMTFDVFSYALLDIFSIYTSIGEFIMAKIIYRNFLISLHHKVTHVDLVELNMLDSYVILGIGGCILVMLLLILEPEWSNFSFQMSLS